MKNPTINTGNQLGTQQQKLLPKTEFLSQKQNFSLKRHNNSPEIEILRQKLIEHHQKVQMQVENQKNNIRTNTFLWQRDMQILVRERGDEVLGVRVRKTTT